MSVSEERDADAVFDALCGNHAREILVAASDGPRSARSLAEHCDASLPTVYRRVNALVEAGLLEELTQVAADGNHYTRYVSTVDAIHLGVERTGFDVSVRLERDIVDRFGAFWRDLGGPDRNADSSR